MKTIAILVGVMSAVAFAAATGAIASGKGMPEDEFEAIYFAAGMFVFPVILLIVSVFLWQKAAGNGNGRAG